MKRIIILSSLLVAACSSQVEPTKDVETPKEEPVKAQAQTAQDFEILIKNNKMALRKCIIANRDLAAIRNIEKTANGTTLLVENKNGSLVNCETSPSVNKATQTPADASAATNTAFYPVGRAVAQSCSNRQQIFDNNNRLMGVFCK